MPWASCGGQVCQVSQPQHCASQQPHPALPPMARRGLVPVVGAGAAALLASSSQSFAVPRAATEAKVGVGALGAYAKGSAPDVAPSQLGLAGVACAVAAGLAATRRQSRAAGSSTRAETTCRVACAASGGKKRCLVMGGTRFIGCYLVAKLREQGHDVVVCNRGKTNGGKPEPLPGVAWLGEMWTCPFLNTCCSFCVQRPPQCCVQVSDADYQQMLSGVSVLVADRKDPASLKAALAGAGKFDIVFDNNVRKLNEVQPLVEGVQSTGGCEQFILMSSAGVYGPTDVLPLSEENPGDPNSRHKEKLQCEQYLDSQGLNWTSIRSLVFLDIYFLSMCLPSILVFGRSTGVRSSVHLWPLELQPGGALFLWSSDPWATSVHPIWWQVHHPVGTLWLGSLSFFSFSPHRYIRV